MSAPSKNLELQKLLTDRGMNIYSLADQIFTSRTHLSQVLSGKRLGSTTWRKLRKVLTDAEYKQASEFAVAKRAAMENPEASAFAKPGETEPA